MVTKLTGLSLIAAAITCTVSLTTTVARAAGEQPIEYEMKVERAAQATIWAIPAVAIWDVAVAAKRDLGGDVGDVIYLTGLRDHDGNLFNGTSSYRLRVPKDAPARDFWSVIVYSMKTKGFVDGVERVGLSSKEMGKMKANADGSVDVYFAPKSPAGLESNWIPTREDFFLLFRLYGPEKPLFDKTWKLDDVEKVK